MAQHVGNVACPEDGSTDDTAVEPMLSKNAYKAIMEEQESGSTDRDVTIHWLILCAAKRKPDLKENRRVEAVLKDWPPLEDALHVSVLYLQIIN